MNRIHVALPESPGRFKLKFTVLKGSRYNCQNPTCRQEIERVADSRSEERTNPRCTRGGIMKRVYSKPALRKLTETEATALRESLELPRPSRS